VLTCRFYQLLRFVMAAKFLSAERMSEEMAEVPRPRSRDDIEVASDASATPTNLDLNPAHIVANAADAFEDNVILVFESSTAADIADDAFLAGEVPVEERSLAGEHDGDGAGAGGAGGSKKTRKGKYTSIGKAGFHVFKGNVGVGVFLLPMVYNDCGYVMSPLLGTLIGSLVIDATLMLVNAKNAINQPTVLSYPDVCQYVFGKRARHVVNGMIVVTQFGFCLMYVQTAAGIFAELMPFHGAYLTFVALECCLCIPLSLLTNNLSLLAVSSMVATVLVFFSVVATLMSSFRQLGEQGASPSVTAFGRLQQYSMFFASQLTVLEGVCVVLPVENTIKKEKRKQFTDMLKRTLGCIIVMYALYGSTGYAAFGRALKTSTVSVLEPSPFTTVVRLALAINVLLTHPLQFCPAIQILDRAFKIDATKATKECGKALGLRVGANVLICCMAAMVGPDALDLVLAFIGSVAATSIAVMLPAFLQLHVQHAIAKHQIAALAAAGGDAALQNEDRGAGEVDREVLLEGGESSENDNNSFANKPKPLSQRAREAATAAVDYLRVDSHPVVRSGAIGAVVKVGGPKKKLDFRKLRCVFYIVFGVYVLITGSISCVYDASEYFGGGGAVEGGDGEQQTRSPLVAQPAGNASATMRHRMFNVMAAP
jgi:proton-coupled amino acid transporter